MARTHRRDRRVQSASSGFPLGAQLYAATQAAKQGADKIRFTPEVINVTDDEPVNAVVPLEVGATLDPTGMAAFDIIAGQNFMATDAVVVAGGQIEVTFTGATDLSQLIIPAWLTGMRLSSGQWLAANSIQGIT